MSRLTLQDSRRLKFTVPALLDAALAFDREHNGWMWRAVDHCLVVDAGGGGAVTLQARKSGADAPETITRSPAWMAAALLYYCFKRRIPIPRSGAKTLEVLPDGIALLVEVAVVLPPLELTRAAFDAAERQRIAGAIAAPPVEAEPFPSVAAPALEVQSPPSVAAPATAAPEAVAVAEPA